jgi:hypothetical protein
MKYLNILSVLLIPFFIACASDDSPMTEVDTTADESNVEFIISTSLSTGVTQIKAISGGTIIGVSENEIVEQRVVYST